MRKISVRAGAGVVLALLVGSILLAQCGPAPGEVIDSPTMLYFYAKW